MDESIRLKTAAEQADAILALDGDDPDALSRSLREALDRGELTPEEYRQMVVRRAQELDRRTPDGA